MNYPNRLKDRNRDAAPDVMISRRWGNMGSAHGVGSFTPVPSSNVVFRICSCHSSGCLGIIYVRCGVDFSLDSGISFVWISFR